MKFRIKQLDTSDASPRGANNIEKELNQLAENLEKEGCTIVAEDFMPQVNAVRSILILSYEKKKADSARYSYQILDSRNGFGIVDKMLNERVLELEKDGAEVIRCDLIPMKNDAFVQFLMYYKIAKTTEKVKEEIVEKEISKEKIAEKEIIKEGGNKDVGIGKVGKEETSK